MSNKTTFNNKTQQNHNKKKVCCLLLSRFSYLELDPTITREERKGQGQEINFDSKSVVGDHNEQPSGTCLPQRFVVKS